MSDQRCVRCGSDRIKATPSGRRYCIPCRLAHEKRRKGRSGYSPEPSGMTNPKPPKGSAGIGDATRGLKS